MDWLAFLYFGKGSGLVRTHSLDLDAQRTLELEEFRSLPLHRGSKHTMAAVAAGAPDAMDEFSATSGKS